MKPKKDKRITASSISLKQFFVIFAVMFFTCGNYHLFFMRNFQENSSSGIVIVLVSSLIGAFLMGVFKRVYFDKPVLKIAKAARKVTEGDFGVRIPPHRKDGKVSRHLRQSFLQSTQTLDSSPLFI